MKLLLMSILGIVLSFLLLAQQDKVIAVADEMPRFPGCEHLDASVLEKKQCSDKALLQFIYTNVKYPRLAQILGIEGMTVGSFIVRADGSIDSIKIIRDPDPTGSLGQETRRILELVQHMDDKWTPGLVNEQPVHVKYNLPLRFKLNGDSDTQSPELSKDIDWTAYNNYSFHANEEIYTLEEVDELPYLTNCKQSKSKDKQALCTTATLHQYLLKKVDKQYINKKKMPNAYFSFVVDANGKVGNFKVSGLQHKCLTELEVRLHFMKLDLEWQPALVDGQPVSCLYKGVFNFKKFKKQK